MRKNNLLSNGKNGTHKRVQPKENSTTITSINSYASFLKQKFAFSKNADTSQSDKKQRYLLGILFLILVCVLITSHVYYYEEVLQREYFPYTRFNSREKYMRLYNERGSEIGIGFLGIDLPETDKVYDCSMSSLIPKNTRCFEWMQQARVLIQHKKLPNSVNCYNLRWYSLSRNKIPTNLTDCYEIGYIYGQWYGGGGSFGMPSAPNKINVQMTPFVTGSDWGNVIRKYFINSKGVSISVDENIPLYVSANSNERPNKLCLQARLIGLYEARKTALNYTVCTSSDMNKLHSLSWSPREQEDPANTNLIYTLLEEPVWQIPLPNSRYMTEGNLLNYTDVVINLGFFRQGHIILNEFWQRSAGDLIFDADRFPTVRSTLDIIRRRGFKIILNIQPFISTESLNFPLGVRNNFFVEETRWRTDKRNIPSLTSYKTSQSAAVLDITKNETALWFKSKITTILDDLLIDGLFLDLGVAYDMPSHFQFGKNLDLAEDYKMKFANFSRNISKNRVLCLSSSFTVPKVPIFVAMAPLASDWTSLQTVIPTILNHGILGYPFIMPGPIGGEGLPDKELYVRWLQLGTFLPVVRYSVLPIYYGEDVLEIANKLTVLRRDFVNSVIKEFVEEALVIGRPIIRPIWMLDVWDPACHFAKDEFAVGNDLIVAPVVHARIFQREIYLPAGVWRDGLQGTILKGSRWLHNYKVTLKDVPHFIRKSDDARIG